ncbi:MAG: glycosyltransferase family 2 protein [Methylacidiphilales bacterium]|nr:glycosyltransferase family 2 protein [Candidatus Methylacidiphilales bacterium]NJR15200.1 glycosyltransferase family 2 protein [Calothrix sp. CSU_2_0]
MLVTVIVPTYRRPQDLARCLEALQHQNRPADEVLVIVRDTDAETWKLLETIEPKSLPIKICKVSLSGVVIALNTALDTASGDIIAITDDDAMPHPDWLERIEAYFLSDSQIGGVGGRDWMYQGDKLVEGAKEIVGKVQWFGRMIGEHHVGVGLPREVDILKGVNMSYRASAIAHIRFDTRLRGTGAQVHNELGFSLAVQKAGWKLIYDPKVAVNHYPAQRFDEDKRTYTNQIAYSNKVYNETLILLEYLPLPRKLVYIIWAIFVGTRDGYGIVQLVRFLLSERAIAFQKFIASIQGRWQAWQTWQNSDRISKISQSPILTAEDLK